MISNPLQIGLEEAGFYLPVTIVVFGASGDLFRKKLLPSLFALYEAKLLGPFKLIGVARRFWDTAAFRSEAAKELEKLPAEDPSSHSEFLKQLYFLQTDFNSAASFKSLKALIQSDPLIIYYLATPPEAIPVIITALKGNELAFKQSRIVIEKPFGHNLASAQELEKRLKDLFSPEQIFRIDHYLGKETVQNLLALRFANTIFEAIWNRNYIERVEITIAESEGIGNRGLYYEKNGARRDMLQNHLLQLLCYVAMDKPAAFSPASLVHQKLKVLKALTLPKSRQQPSLVLGQYTAGFIDGQAVPGYHAEPQVAADSRVETYIALLVFIDNSRWRGVPFCLRTGKRLSRRLSEINLYFKRHTMPAGVFFTSQPLTNLLCWQLQPEESMRLRFNSKLPGFNQRLTAVTLNFTYSTAFGQHSPTAYERLLLDIFKGDQSLFISAEEVMQSWRFIAKLERHCQRITSPLNYPAGSSGPREADLILKPFQARWKRL